VGGVGPYKPRHPIVTPLSQALYSPSILRTSSQLSSAQYHGLYEKYKDRVFPSLREQLDMYFDSRYKVFWTKERRKQEPLIPPPMKPHPLRLEFDLEVIKSVGSNLTKEDVLRAYEAIVWDTVITRGLRKD